MNSDGSDNQQISTGYFYGPGLSWSRKGDRLAYKSNKNGKTEIYFRDIKHGTEIVVANMKEAPGGVARSLDDRQLAFHMFVPKPKETFCKLPEKPEKPEKPGNAKWNDPPVYIDILPYRRHRTILCRVENVRGRDSDVKDS